MPTRVLRKAVHGEVSHRGHAANETAWGVARKQLASGGCWLPCDAGAWCPKTMNSAESCQTGTFLQEVSPSALYRKAAALAGEGTTFRGLKSILTEQSKRINSVTGTHSFGQRNFPNRSIAVDLHFRPTSTTQWGLIQLWLWPGSDLVLGLL